MIQRIQSVFLFVGALAVGALFFLPFAKSEIATSGFLADQTYDSKDHVLLLVLIGLGTGLLLISIFLHKKRKWQLRFTLISVFIAILIPVCAFLLFNADAPQQYKSPQIHGQAGLFLPVVAIIAGIAARYYIRKDEKLVKSMDRLR